jgi:hypothetical protein
LARPPDPLRGSWTIGDQGHAHQLNALTLFVVAHAASEAGTAAVNATAAPGSQDFVASLDAQQFPLLTAAARTSAGTDAARFEFAIAAFIRGLTPITERSPSSGSPQ